MSQVWLITGSSRGLGRAFAEATLAAGCQVAATARKVEDLAELKNKYGDLVLPLVLDVTNETQAHQTVQATIRTFGKLDVLVNNAGYGNVAPVEDTTHCGSLNKRGPVSPILAFNIWGTQSQTS